MNEKDIDTMTPEELAAYRKQKAKETRRRNAEAREARRQQEQSDRELIINTLRDVLKAPNATVRQRLRAAQLLAEIKG